MKFEEALYQFKMELIKEYGIEEPLVKLGIHPDLMDRTAAELFMQPGGQYRFTLSQFGEFTLNGVQIVPRRKDSF